MVPRGSMWSQSQSQSQTALGYSDAWPGAQTKGTRMLFMAEQTKPAERQSYIAECYMHMWPLKPSPPLFHCCHFLSTWQFVKLVEKGKTSQKVTKLNGNENGKETYRGGRGEERVYTLLLPARCRCWITAQWIGQIEGESIAKLLYNSMFIFISFWFALISRFTFFKSFSDTPSPHKTEREREGEITLSLSRMQILTVATID